MLEIKSIGLNILNLSTIFRVAIFLRMIVRQCFMIRIHDKKFLREYSGTNESRALKFSVEFFIISRALKFSVVKLYSELSNWVVL